MKVVVDTQKEDYPKIISRLNDNPDENAFLMVDVMLQKDGESFEAKVINISSNGKYTLEIIDKKKEK